MYIIKCKILKLDSLVTFKRFYNPPTKRTWSKQNPLFKTPRPLVEPYNLGRLHPEKEWWNLPKKGLKPDTFMGFPDVANIEKHGGSLYTHFMDGPTLSMVIYRCIDKKINNVEIWKALTLQALKLAMSLDPYLISILFLYYSLSSYYDYKFVSTFVGRILATLDQFGLEECSNVILAMNNPQFYHERTFDYVIMHSENLCLTGQLKIEECLRFLSCLKNVEKVPQNCLTIIGGLIEMSDLSIIENMLLFDSIDSCCRLKDKIDRLCVAKLFNECCRILESMDSCNHYFNLVALYAMVTYGFKNDYLFHSIIKRLNDNIHECTYEEKCRYIYLLSKFKVTLNKISYSNLYNKDMDYNFTNGSSVSLLTEYDLDNDNDETFGPYISNKNVGDKNNKEKRDNKNDKSTNKVLMLTDLLKKEVMNNFDKLVNNYTLSFWVAVGILNSNSELNSHELKLLDGYVNKLNELSKEEALELYNSLSNTKVSLDGLDYIRRTVVNQCWSLDDLSLSQFCCLLDYKQKDLFDLVPKHKLDYCFNHLSGNLSNLNSKEILLLVKFSTKNKEYSSQLLPKLKDHKSNLYNPNLVVELIELYKMSNKNFDEFLYELLDGLCMARQTILSEERLKLVDALNKNNIKYDSLKL